MRVFGRKRLTIPASNETTTTDTVQLWVVTWLSRYGKFCDDVNKEFEAFTSEDDANAFAESLRNAYGLIRHTSGISVDVSITKSV